MAHCTLNRLILLRPLAAAAAAAAVNFTVQAPRRQLQAGIRQRRQQRVQRQAAGQQRRELGERAQQARPGGAGFDHKGLRQRPWGGLCE